MKLRDPSITSRMMSKIPGKNTKPELALRRELFRRGMRYRVHDGRLPGRPDLVFTKARLVVFVDGDFWHGGGWEARGLSRFEDQFGHNRDFWIKKISRNVDRDQEVNEALDAAGWRVIRILESAIRTDLAGQVVIVERCLYRKVGPRDG